MVYYFCVNMDLSFGNMKLLYGIKKNDTIYYGVPYLAHIIASNQLQQKQWSLFLQRCTLGDIVPEMNHHGKMGLIEHKKLIDELKDFKSNTNIIKLSQFLEHGYVCQYEKDKFVANRSKSFLYECPAGQGICYLSYIMHH